MPLSYTKGRSSTGDANVIDWPNSASNPSPRLSSAAFHLRASGRPPCTVSRANARSKRTAKCGPADPGWWCQAAASYALTNVVRRMESDFLNCVVWTCLPSRETVQQMDVCP